MSQSVAPELGALRLDSSALESFSRLGRSSCADAPSKTRAMRALINYLTETRLLLLRQQPSENDPAARVRVLLCAR